MKFFCVPAYCEEKKTEEEQNHKAEALVLSCVDYRLTEDVANSLRAEGLAEKYDLISLAGGALAVVNDYFPFARDTFWAHLALLKNIHHFQRVIIIDHRNCGMYKFVYNQDLSLNPEEEKRIHIHTAEKLVKEIQFKYPDLKVETWLLDLNGKFEKTIPSS